MFDSIRLIPLGACTAGAALLSLSLIGCKPKDNGPNPKPPPGAHVHGDGDGHDHDGAHDHAHGDSDGHDHDGDHDHAHGDSDGHDHDGDHDHGDSDGHNHDSGHDHAHGEGDGHTSTGATHTIDAIAFGGRAMTVVVEGSGAPGSELHVEGEITTGPVTDTLRVWVGSEDGAGARKTRMNITNGHFHAHVMIPQELLAGSALWFQAMTVDGERQSVSMPL